MKYRLFLSIISVLLSFSCNLGKSNREKETSQVHNKYDLDDGLNLESFTFHTCQSGKF